VAIDGIVNTIANPANWIADHARSGVFCVLLTGQSSSESEEAISWSSSSLAKAVQSSDNVRKVLCKSASGLLRARRKHSSARSLKNKESSIVAYDRFVLDFRPTAAWSVASKIVTSMVKETSIDEPMAWGAFIRRLESAE
jgi:hypothetical protein